MAKRIVRFVLECGCVHAAPMYLRAGRARMRCPTCEPRRPRGTRNPDAPRDCRCCGAPHVEGQTYPDWCANCEGCDPNGEYDEDSGPTFDHRCPRPSTESVTP